MKNVALIAAVSKNGVIGKNNRLPWKLPADMKHFVEITTGHIVIMGSKTFQSLGKPLPNRLNIVISKKLSSLPECVVVDSPKKALEIFTDKIMFVTGGGEIYKYLLPYCEILYITRVHTDFEGDAYFPEVNWNEWKEIGRQDFKADAKNKYDYSFLIFQRKNLLAKS